MPPAFLELDEILALHEDQLRRYGGSVGVRDLGLLSSAAAMPEAAFGGELLHEDLFAMAAAYLFHIAKNHPFVDGNKRTALAASLAFLWLNGFRLETDENQLLDLVVGIADGTSSKADAAVFFARHAVVIEPDSA